MQCLAVVHATRRRRDRGICRFDTPCAPTAAVKCKQTESVVSATTSGKKLTETKIKNPNETKSQLSRRRGGHESKNEWPLLKMHHEKQNESGPPNTKTELQITRSPRTKIQLSTVCVKPVIFYGSIAWAPNTSRSDWNNKIETV